MSILTIGRDEMLGSQHHAAEDREKDRKRIQEEVADFLAAGGEITYCEAEDRAVENILKTEFRGLNRDEKEAKGRTSSGALCGDDLSFTKKRVEGVCGEECAEEHDPDSEATGENADQEAKP